MSLRACVLFAQDRAHFAIWCIMASPLIAGNDLRSMSNGTRDILTNAHAIAINQDPLGAQATLVAGQHDPEGAEWQVWAKPLSQPPRSWAVLLLNRMEGEAAGRHIVLDFSVLPGTPCGACAHPPRVSD